MTTDAAHSNEISNENSIGIIGQSFEIEDYIQDQVDRHKKNEKAEFLARVDSKLAQHSRMHLQPPANPRGKSYQQRSLHLGNQRFNNSKNMGRRSTMSHKPAQTAGKRDESQPARPNGKNLDARSPRLHADNMLSDLAQKQHKPSSGEYLSNTQTTKTQEQPRANLAVYRPDNQSLPVEIQSKDFASGFSDVQSNTNNVQAAKDEQEKLKAKAKATIQFPGLTFHQRFKRKKEFLAKLESLNDEARLKDMKDKKKKQAKLAEQRNKVQSFAARVTRMFKNIINHEEMLQLEKYEQEQKRYRYDSHTDDEGKYVTKTGSKFLGWDQEKRDQHIRERWREAYNKALAASVIINQEISVHAKIAYFGRQMLSLTNAGTAIQNQRKKNKVLPFILEPQSCFKAAWGLAIIILIFYTATITPYLMSFHDDPPADAPTDVWRVMEVIIDAVFIADIFINFISAFERRDGTYEYSLKKIAVNYLTGFFSVDLMASIPFTDLVGGAEEEVEAAGQQSTGGPKANSLIKLARLQRLYRLMRIIRIVKLLNVDNYSRSLSRTVSKYKIGNQISRMFKIVGLIMLTSHLFSCFFYMAAKFQDFSPATWVVSKGFENDNEFKLYQRAVYWSFQTLTTVGYGDFGAITSYEMLVTIVWMGIGVAIYSIVVGSLTSLISDEYFSNENLAMKLKALEQFREESDLDQELYDKLRSFISNNYYELFQRIDEDSMLNELPSTLKEEVMFHQYGAIIKKFHFFEKVNNNDFVWGAVKCLKKISFDKNDTIYFDDSISDCMYLIHKGFVKLYAENDFPFAVYRISTTFGDIDIFCNQRRNGTAKAMEYCQFYKVLKSNIEELFLDYPEIKKRLFSDALEKNEKLIQHRLQIIKKNPIYGLKEKQQQNVLRMTNLMKSVEEAKEQLQNDEASEVSKAGTSAQNSKTASGNASKKQSFHGSPTHARNGGPEASNKAGSQTEGDQVDLTESQKDLKNKLNQVLVLNKTQFAADKNTQKEETAANFTKKVNYDLGLYAAPENGKDIKTSRGKSMTTRHAARESLDFANQRINLAQKTSFHQQRATQSYSPTSAPRYIESKRISDLKHEYVATNQGALHDWSKLRNEIQAKTQGLHPDLLMNKGLNARKARDTLVSDEREEAIRTIIEYKEFQELSSPMPNKDGGSLCVPACDPTNSDFDPDDPHPHAQGPNTPEEEAAYQEVAENSFNAIVRFNEDMKILATNAYQMNELLGYAMQENDLILDWVTKLEANTISAEESLVKLSPENG